MLEAFGYRTVGILGQKKNNEIAKFPTSVKKKAVKTEDAYDEEEAVRIAMANSLNDVLPTKLEDALDWSARDHEREEEERQRRIEAEERELLARYERWSSSSWTTPTRTTPARATSTAAATTAQAPVLLRPVATTTTVAGTTRCSTATSACRRCRCCRFMFFSLL